MKRILNILYMLLFAEILLAQTQQCYVKTRGRMVNGKHVKGMALTGAVVSIKGQNSVVVNNTDGSFTFPVKNRQFYINSVTKNGYELVDADAVPKNYVYSANPLFLLLETPKKQAEDRLIAEQTIRRSLQQRLRQREEEIEALKVSQEEKDSLLRLLYQQQGDNERLIADMAKEYSQIDYDQMEEKNRQISDAIINGELTKAYSLIRSNGNMNDRIKNLQREQQAESQREKEIAREQQELSVSKEGTEKKRDAIAQDCYSLFKMFKLQHQKDSAAYYLELRASLDTTNVEWMIECGLYAKDYICDNERAIALYNEALQRALGRESKYYSTLCYNNISAAYLAMGEYEKALEYSQKIISLLDEAGLSNKEKALFYITMGAIYHERNLIDDGLKYYNKALSQLDNSIQDHWSAIATCYNNIGGLYLRQKNYDKALVFYSKAVDIQSLVSLEGACMGTTYNNIGLVYDEKGDYAQALSFYEKDLAISMSVYGERHPVIAQIYNSIGGIYYRQERFEESLDYYEKALDIRKECFDYPHPLIRSSYQNLGTALDNMGMHMFALQSYERAIETSISLGNNYFGKGDYENALISFLYPIETYENVFEPDDIILKQSYESVGAIYELKGDISEAIRFYELAMKTLSNTFGVDSPQLNDLRQHMDYCKYLEAFSLDEESKKARLSGYVVILTTNEEESAAKAAGLDGKYYLLELEDWDMNSDVSIFEKIDELRDKPKDILLMKDNMIMNNHFDGYMGVVINVEHIGDDVRGQINKIYQAWKSQNR